MSRGAVLLRLLRQLRPAMWGIIIFVVLVRFLNQAIIIVILAMAAWGIGQVLLTTDAVLQDFFQSYFMITLVLLGVVKGLFFYLEQYVGASLSLRLVETLRMQLYNRLEPLAPAGLMELRSGDIIARAIGDLDQLETFYGQTIGTAVVAVLLPVVAIWAIAWVNVWLALLFVPFIVTVALLVPWLSDDLGKTYTPRMRAAMADVSAHMTDSIQGLREVIVFGQRDARLHEVRANDARLTAVQGRLADVGGLHEALVGALVGTSLVSLLGVGLVLVRLGQLPLAELPAVLAVAVATFEPMLGSQRNLVSGLNQAIAGGSRLFAIIDQPLPVQETATVAPPEPVEPAIIFSGVFFRYAHAQNNGHKGHKTGDDGTGNAKDTLVTYTVNPGPGTQSVNGGWVLNNLNLTIPAGRTVALVGPSGAGKTTVVNLLLRFWDVDAGSVHIGGHDLRAFPQEELRRKIAVVAQRTHIFGTTIRENLLLGNPSASDAAIEQAARMANIHDFIISLPDGYQTLVGEMGARLSGGQRQRLAIARALLKDAPILILDEATSSLDAVNERAIQSAIRRLMAGRTTLIIAHRLSTVVYADKILVIDRGRIVEQGRHADLLALGGVYAHLFALQQDDLLLAGGPDA